jgi:hypothetical protein
MIRLLAIIALGLVAPLTRILAQDDSLAIERVMTPEEMQITGVASLTPQQEAALSAWLVRYTDNLMRVAPLVNATPLPGRYQNPGGARWLKMSTENGALLGLDDGSVWQLKQGQEGYTELWKAGDEIRLVSGSNNEYVLEDVQKGRRAVARYLGRY